MIDSKPELALKIAFVGASCTGKTTLLEALRSEYAKNPSVAFVEEAARTYFTQHPDIGDRFSFDAQSQVQALALKRELLAHYSGAQVIFCDRSVFDAAAYVRSTGDNAGSDRLLYRVRHWRPTYTRVFLLDPRDIRYKVDEVRQENKFTRQRLHLAFLEMFMENQISFELLSGSRSERLRTVNLRLRPSL